MTPSSTPIPGEDLVGFHRHRDVNAGFRRTVCSLHVPPCTRRHRFLCNRERRLPYCEAPEIRRLDLDHMTCASIDKRANVINRIAPFIGYKLYIDAAFSTRRVNFASHSSWLSRAGIDQAFNTKRKRTCSLLKPQQVVGDNIDVLVSNSSPIMP